MIILFYLDWGRHLNFHLSRFDCIVCVCVYRNFTFFANIKEITPDDIYFFSFLLTSFFLSYSIQLSGCKYIMFYVEVRIVLYMYLSLLFYISLYRKFLYLFTWFCSTNVRNTGLKVPMYMGI